VREFNSYAVLKSGIYRCSFCDEKIEAGETFTEPEDSMLRFCGDCLLAANLSRLDVLLTGLEQQVTTLEQKPLDTGK
jgi:hypothetical protein